MAESEDLTVENALRRTFRQAEALGWVKLGAEQEAALLHLARSLLRWNRTFNLTSITAPSKVAELHILDSLAIVPHLPDGGRVLDVGAGAGFPGLPAAVARPDTDWRLVDRTEKKVAFMKTAIAQMRLRNAKALHLRLEGLGTGEGLEPFDVAVSRAFTAPERWLPFASPYVREGGLVITMLGGQGVDEERLASRLGLEGRDLRSVDYRLPSGAARGLLLWRKG